MKVLQRKLAFLICGYTLLAPVEVLANWSANLQAPQDSNELLRIELPADLDIMTLTTLLVEVDGIDVTALMEMDGNTFVYRPVTPFKQGEHTVRLIQLGENGESVPKDNWSFSITSTSSPDEGQVAAIEAWLKSASVQADTYTEFSKRIADQNLGSPTYSRGIVSGSGDINTEITSENWSFTGQGNYLAQTEHKLALTNNVVDVGEYTLKATYQGDLLKGGMTLGHHDIGVDSILLSGFYRRGASVNLGDSDGMISATGFAFRPDSITGARDFTGLSNSKYLVRGTSAVFQPFSQDIDALKITGLYYDGRKSLDGNGVYDSNNDTVSSKTGSGWGTIVEKSFANRRLELRGEFARSSYDEDGSNSDFEEETANATSFSMQARPFNNLTFDDRTADLLFGVRYQHIDTAFASLANEGLAADKDAYSAFSSFYWDAFSASLEVGQETNNVDEIAGLPTDQLRYATLGLGYSFDQQEGSLSWLGTPYINLSGNITDITRIKTPQDYGGYDTDNNSTSVSLGGGSSYDAWFWSANYTRSQFSDDANVSSDTISHFISLSSGWTVSNQLELTGSTSVGGFRDRSNHTINYDKNLNLGVNAILLPDKLNLNFDYNLNFSSGSGDTPDSQVFNSEVEYTLIQPDRNRPGLALAILGSVEDRNDNANSYDDETAYQIYTALRVKAPFGFNY